MENPGYCKTCEDHTTGPGRNVEPKRLFDINTDCHWLFGANRYVSQACYQHVIGNAPFKKSLFGIFAGSALLYILIIIAMKFVVGGTT